MDRPQIKDRLEEGVAKWVVLFMTPIIVLRYLPWWVKLSVLLVFFLLTAAIKLLFGVSLLTAFVLLYAGGVVLGTKIGERKTRNFL